VGVLTNSTKMRGVLLTFIFLLVLGIPNNVHSQCPAGAITFTSSTVPSNCASDGSMTINASGGLSPYLYEIISGPVVRLAQSSNQFNGLPAGTYQVKVTDQCATTLVQTVVVAGSYQTPSITIVDKKPTCANSVDGGLTVTVTGGLPPYTYALVNPSPITAGPQNSNSFSNLSAGTYTVQIIDACNNIQTKTYTLAHLNLGIPQARANRIKVSCNNIQFSGYAQASPFGSQLMGLQYAITAGQVTFPYQSSNIFIVPQGGSYTISVKDTCGRTTSRSYSTDPDIYLEEFQTCSGAGIEVDAWDDYFLAPITYEITAGPQLAGPQSSNTFSNLPNGTYTVKVTDACGTTRSESITILFDDLDAFFDSDDPWCDLPLVKVRLQVRNFTNPVVVSYVSGPQSFPNQTFNAWGPGVIDWSGVFPGTYTVNVTDACGNSDLVTFTTTAVYSGTFTFDVEPSCNGANITNLNLVQNTYNSREEFAITSGPVTFGFQEVSFFNNLPPGTYVVAARPYLFRNCNTPVHYETVVIPDYNNPQLDLYGTICNGANTSGDILCQVTNGVPSYSYEVISGPVTRPPQGSNTFSNMPNGTYQVRVVDSCGNSVIKGIELAKYGDDNIHPSQTCEGGTFTMYADTLPYATFSWTGPNGFSSNNRFITINPFTAADTGTYSVHVKYNTCIDTVINVHVTFLAKPDPSFMSTNICNGSNNSIQITGASGGVFSFDPLPNDGASINPSTGVISNAVPGNSYTIKYSVSNGGCSDESTVTIKASNASLTLNPVQINCNGANNGSISSTVSNGQSPLTYLWNTNATSSSINNLSPGVYVLTLTDGLGCQITKSATISQPNALSITSTVVDVACNNGNNGSISLSVSGGTANYSYQWSNNANSSSIINLSAGNYSVTVTDANNCTKTQTFTINQPNAISISESITNPVCNGVNSGSISLTVSGGTPAFNYIWNNNSTNSNISNVGAGTYQVTVTDANGCSKTKSFTITEPASLTNNATMNMVSCFGGNNGSIAANLSGGIPSYSYSWSNNSTNPSINSLIAGNYTLTTTDANGCQKIDNYSITQPADLNISSQLTHISCNGGNTGAIQLTISGGTPSYIFAWSNNATTQSLSGLSAGNYMVTLTDNNNCQKIQSFTINQTSAMTATPTITNVSCNGGNNGSISLSISGGANPYSYTWSNNGNAPSINNLTAGTYSVTVTDANNCQSSFTYSVTEPNAIQTSHIAANNNCFGANSGVGTISVSGGTPTYAYSWPNSAGNQTTQTATGLSSGTFPVTITDANNCTKIESVVITSPPAITISNISNDVNCNGSTNGTATLIVSGGTPGYTYTWPSTANNQTTQTATGLSANSYITTVTDAKGCSSTDTIVISEPSPITITDSITNALCNGGNTGQATIYPTGGTPSYAYTWPSSAGNQTTQTATGLSSGTYVVSVSDSKNCLKTISISITEPNSLILTDSTSNVLCNGDNSGSATINATGGVPVYQYTWPAQANNQTTQTATGLVAGSYICTVTDNNNCSQTITTTINEPTLLQMNKVVQDLLCSNDSSGSIQLTITGGIAPYSYSWSTNNSGTNTATGLNSGMYFYTVTDSNGCTLIDSSMVNEPSPLSITNNYNNTLCNGDNSGSSTLIVSGGTPNYSYSWPNSASNQTTQTATGLSAGVYVVTVTDLAGCSATDSVVIQEPLKLTANDSINNVECNGDNSGDATIFVSGGVAPYQYAWPSSANNQNTQTATGLIAGIYSVTFTDNNGCYDSLSIAIGEPSALILTMSSPQMEDCGFGNGQALGLATGGTPLYNYLWSNNITDSLNTNLSGGWYVLTVTDINGCIKTDSIEVLVDYSVGGPNSNIAVTDPTCNGLGDGTATSSPSSGLAPYEHIWSTGDTTSSVDSLAPGSYQVTITDGYGCYSLDTIQINITPAINLNITGRDTICIGDSTLLVVSGFGNLQYDWGNDNKNDSLLVSPNSDSLFIVHALNDNKCVESDSILVHINPLPIVEIKGNPNVCEFENTILTAQSSNGIQYLWNSGDTTAQITVFSEDLLNYYEVTITDNHGCYGKNSSPFKINILDKPVAQFDTSSSGVFSSQIEFLDQSYSDIISWSWYFGDESNSNLQNPVHDYKDIGNYEIMLIVENEVGCLDTTYGEVSLIEDIEIPNVFTPNGDGFNDVFIIPSSGMKEFSLIIYNRWGSELFRTEASRVSWDGMTISGRPAPEGTYFYELKAKGEKDYSTTGTLTLIRK
jgi:gliding motility-associated-like protein